MNANRKRVPNDQAVTKTLHLSGNYAFRLMRRGKWRRAANMAQSLLRELPPSMRRSADALCLRVVGKAGRYIADWLVAEKAEDERRRTRKKRARRTGRASGEVAPMALSTSHLLLVPEYPMVPDDSPAEVGEKQ